MKNHLPNWYIFLSVLILIGSVGMFIFSGAEVYNVGILNGIEFYPFGSEGPVAGIWQYENKENYTNFNIVTMFLSFINVVLVLVGLLNNSSGVLKFSYISFVSTFLILHIIQENYFKIW